MNVKKTILQPFWIIIFVTISSVGAFSGGLWASLAIAGALLCALCIWVIDKKFPSTPKEISALTLIALAAFAAELPFSFAFTVSCKVWLQLATIFLPLLLLTSPRLQQVAYSRPLFVCVGLAMLCGAAFLGVELSSGGSLLHFFRKATSPLTEYNRGMAHIAILAFPVIAALVLSNGRLSATALAFLLLIPASLTESHTAKLALIIGTLFGFAAYLKPLWVRHMLGAGVIAAMSWPLIAQEIFTHYRDRLQTLHASWLHRMEIWDYLSYRVAERPFFGWGLGTTHLLDFTQPHAQLYKFVIEPAPHAHNFAVTLWVETGFLGVVICSGFLLGTLRAAGDLHPKLRPYALGGFASALTVASFGFDFWTDALWAAFALSAFAFGMMQQRLQRRQDLVD